MALFRRDLSDAIGDPTIEYRSLSEITAEKLRTAIITGGIKPGTRVTETEIAESMGVSRVVVREAILMLMREGLLVKQRNKFTMVTPIDRGDVKDIFDLRIAIEQAAAKRCMQEPGFMRDTLPLLEARSEQINMTSTGMSVNRKELMYMDMSFHSMIIQASGNLRLSNVWEELSGPLFLLLYRYITTGNALHYSHGEILDAFKTGDVSTVDKELFTHIEDTKTMLMETLPS